MAMKKETRDIYFLRVSRVRMGHGCRDDRCQDDPLPGRPVARDNRQLECCQYGRVYGWLCWVAAVLAPLAEGAFPAALLAAAHC